MVEAASVLRTLEPAVATPPDFAALHRLVQTIIRPIVGVGDLTVYDISHRVGAYRGQEPTEVYLHAGTRKGAKALELDTGRKSIPMTDLPVALRMLTAAQAEDVLCIYTKTLVRVRQRSPAVAKR